MARNMQSYENLQHRIYEGVGEYGIPLLEPTKFEKCEFIGFNYCRTCKEKAGKGVHFFLDDYQFVSGTSQTDTCRSYSSSDM